MKVTADVINDLLPIYASGECSGDTRLLVEEFMKANPGMRPATDTIEESLSSSIHGHLTLNDELKSLKATRRRLKIRSSVMGLAIFFSIAPFSFIYTQGKLYSLISESPISAIVYGSLGVICWGIYFMMKRRSGNI